jgi:hypothetical protein
MRLLPSIENQNLCSLVIYNVCSRYYCISLFQLISLSVLFVGLFVLSPLPAQSRRQRTEEFQVEIDEMRQPRNGESFQFFLLLNGFNH